MRIGIVGAGKLGTALARRSVAAGHDVLLATRPGAGHAGLHAGLVVDVMAPGAAAVPVEQWGAVDLAVLAVPLYVALGIDLPLAAESVVVDATNHWEPVDGPRPNLGPRSTSEAMAAAHPGLLWAKSLNQLGYHDLDDGSDVTRVPMRIATDHTVAVETVSAYVASLGMVPVPAGALAAGLALEPGAGVSGGADGDQAGTYASGVRG